MTRYELIVIGAGAAGLGAARAARRAGHTVALAEGARPGGDCTHYGCVPSKALLETARRVAAARSGDRYGFSAAVEVDFPAVLRRVREVVADVERDESPALLARQGIELVPSFVRFTDPHTVETESGQRLHGDRFVIATGAGPQLPAVPGLAELAVLTNRTVFALTRQPEHLLVLGGGPLGCELAQAFVRLGSAVTLLEAGDRLLPKDEPEAGRVLRAALERDGVAVRLGQPVGSASAGPTVRLADGTAVSGSHLLVAGGRRPDTARLALPAAGVQTDPGSGRVRTDDRLRTAAPHIWAAGDVTSALQFTHVGDEQGRLAAANAFARRPRRWNERVLPWVTFTEPEVGHVGLTEEQAFARFGPRARVAFVPLSGQDRARAADSTEGFVKLIAVSQPPLIRTPLLAGLVGMTCVGPAAGELVAEGALAMRTRMLVGRLAQTVHAYPTWSLTVRVAAARFFAAPGEPTARPAGLSAATGSGAGRPAPGRRSGSWGSTAGRARRN